MSGFVTYLLHLLHRCNKSILAKVQPSGGCNKCIKGAISKIRKSFIINILYIYNIDKYIIIYIFNYLFFIRSLFYRVWCIKSLKR